MRALKQLLSPSQHAPSFRKRTTASDTSHESQATAHFSLLVQFDFDEWNRMHFGPSAEERDEALYKRYKEMNQSETFIAGAR